MVLERRRTIICQSNSGGSNLIKTTSPERWLGALVRVNRRRRMRAIAGPNQHSEDDGEVLQTEFIEISLAAEDEGNESTTSEYNEHEEGFASDPNLVEELAEAAKSGDIVIFQRICARALRSHLRLDAPGYMGWTAAHWAAREGHVEILEHLIMLRANLDAVDRKGDTLLHKAAANSQHVLCQWLIERGFKVETRNNNDLTPLDLAQERIAISGRTRSAGLCERILSEACSNMK